MSFVFPDDVAAGGTVNLLVASDGTAKFWGSFHDSGFVPYNYSVACVFVDADGQPWSVGHSGEIGGTVGGGSRTDNINETNNNQELAKNWRAVVATNPVLKGEARVDVDIGTLVNELVQAAEVAAEVIALIG